MPATEPSVRIIENKPSNPQFQPGDIVRFTHAPFSEKFRDRDGNEQRTQIAGWEEVAKIEQAAYSQEFGWYYCGHGWHALESWLTLLSRPILGAK